MISQLPHLRHPLLKFKSILETVQIRDVPHQPQICISLIFLKKITMSGKFQDTRRQSAQTVSLSLYSVGKGWPHCSCPRPRAPYLVVTRSWAPLQCSLYLQDEDSCRNGRRLGSNPSPDIFREEFVAIADTQSQLSQLIPYARKKGQTLFLAQGRVGFGPCRLLCLVWMKVRLTSQSSLRFSSSSK